eukprot:6184261-Pleurochrysis_carterae.AAC.2
MPKELHLWAATTNLSLFRWQAWRRTDLSSLFAKPLLAPSGLRCVAFPCSRAPNASIRVASMRRNVTAVSIVSYTSNEVTNSGKEGAVASRCSVANFACG